MLDIAAAIADIEIRAKARGVPIRHICAVAGVATSNWNRWKTGQNSPTFQTWGQIEKAAKALLAEPDTASAEAAA